MRGATDGVWCAGANRVDTTRLAAKYRVERKRGHSTFSQKSNVPFLLSKEHQDTALTAHTHHTRRREMGFMAVPHNILILRPIKLFYRASLSRYLLLIKAFAHS